MGFSLQTTATICTNKNALVQPGFSVCQASGERGWLRASALWPGELKIEGAIAALEASPFELFVGHMLHQGMPDAASDTYLVLL